MKTLQKKTFYGKEKNSITDAAEKLGGIDEIKETLLRSNATCMQIRQHEGAAIIQICFDLGKQELQVLPVQGFYKGALFCDNLIGQVALSLLKGEDLLFHCIFDNVAVSDYPGIPADAVDPVYGLTFNSRVPPGVK